MAFPGRLHEKEKPIGTYIIVGLVLLFVGLGAWHVVNVINTPLTKVQKKEIHESKSKNGLVEKKANKFSRDVNQIIHGDPLKPTPDVVVNESAVNYDNRPAAANKPKVVSPQGNYYSDQH